MRRLTLLGAACALVAGLLVVPAAADKRSPFEVWAIDQSDTTADGGGTLYVYDGPSLAGRAASKATPRVVDLGGAARTRCLSDTGSAPRRPHMLMFNGTNSHGILAFVATGHVLFLDEDAAPIACLDVGLQAHAAFPAPDDSYVVVADQNGKKLHWIATDYGTNTFVLLGTLDLLPFQGAGRPDNAPICPIIDSTSTLTFVTLRGGGLLVVDTSDAAMEVVGRYDLATVHANGCGGIETGGKMYITSGGGTAANPVESDLYSFPLTGYLAANPENVPARTHVFSRDGEGFVDTHGSALTKHGRYLWLADRADNSITVVDTRTDTIVNEIELVGAVSSDPAPDLMGISPSGNRMFMTLRGPVPLTGNAPGVNNAVGSTPGVGVLRVTKGGRDGVFQGIARITHVVGGVETADPHGLAIRMK